MATPVPKLATYVLAGEVVASPAPLPRYSKVQGAARRFLGGPFDDDDGRGGHVVPDWV